jgi:hypothetical protein
MLRQIKQIVVFKPHPNPLQGRGSKNFKVFSFGEDLGEALKQCGIHFVLLGNEPVR